MFEFVSYLLRVYQGEAFPDSPPLEFVVRRRTISLSVFGVGERVLTWRVKCPVKRRSDLERVLYAINVFLVGKLPRLGNAVGVHDAMGAIFEQCLRKAWESGRSFWIDKGRLTLNCPYFTCCVRFYNGGTFPLGSVTKLRVEVPSAFLPYLLVGQGFELIAWNSEPITQALKEKKLVDVCARCSWDGLEFYLEIGRVHRELLTSLAPTVLEGFLRLSDLLRKS